MSPERRVRVAALVLVNWKGVFYERYLLDRHVTALEGANGAGKTTVMIAAYVVLLPDMTRLRFTNLGESGATGGDRGIWGRLGEAGRPSYAALDLDLDSERVVLGVRLSRASEPTVELTAFIITGLSSERELSEILLSRQLDGDHVPELDEIKSQVSAAGARIEVFRGVKDYFSALFERGITPLRLSSEGERAKWNDLLRTSMTGGISRALGTELRGFLLREEAGLSATLSRMRDNLEACRRTRVEVAESSDLERELSALYAAGQAMFTAAVHAARLDAVGAQERVRLAQQRVSLAAQQAEGLAREQTALRERESEVSQRVAALRTQAAELAAEHERLITARASAERVSALSAEVATLAGQASAVRARQAQAAEEREACQRALTRAREAYDRASLGLVHVQRGLDELNLRAHAHRQWVRRLGEARGLLERPELSQADMPGTLAVLEGVCEQLELTRARLSRQGRDLDARRHEYARAQQLLSALSVSKLFDKKFTEQFDMLEEHALARALLAKYAELSATTHDQAQLAHDIEEAERVAKKQRAARKRFAELQLDESEPSGLQQEAGVPSETPELQAGDSFGVLPPARSGQRAQVEGEMEASSSIPEGEAEARVSPAERVVQALSIAEEELQLIQQQLTPEGLGTDPSAALQAALSAHQELELRSARYREVCAIAERLSCADAREGGLSQLLLLNEHLVAQGMSLKEQLTAREAEREALQLRAAELARGGHVQDAELLRLRDELGAELFSGRFDELDAEAAAWTEARLGPLVNALVVEDVEEAAERLSGLSHALREVYLVRANAGIDVSPPLTAAGEPAHAAKRSSARPAVFAFTEAHGLRLVRAPELPSLGKRAREQALREATEQIASCSVDVERLSTELAENTAHKRELAQLMAAVEVWSAGDPAARLGDLEREIMDLQQRAQARQQTERELQSRLPSLRKRVALLRKLLPDAQWLDGPDSAARAQELRHAQQQAQWVSAELAHIAPVQAELSTLIDALRQPPLDEQAAQRLQSELAELDAQRERAFSARAALTELLTLGHASGAEYAEAEATLAAQSVLTPALEHQHAAARAELEAAEAELSRVTQRWEDITAECQAAEAQLAAAQSHRQRAMSELLAIPMHDSPLDTEVQHVSVLSERVLRAERQLDVIQQELSELETEARALVTEAARSAERYARAQAELRSVQGEQTAQEAAAQPLQAVWQSLRTEAESVQVLHTALASATVSASNSNSTQLWAEADGQRQILLDRASRMRSADDLIADIQAAVEQGGPHRFLQAFTAVRAFLSQRVPAHIAEVMDPPLALERLRDHLEVLAVRLRQKENDLRGSSEDVARGIEVQLRRAYSQVRRLNQQLEGVHFGSIHGIRIELRRIERMEQILRALREGEAQDLLFSATLPIEEALDEIFKRYAGGRGAGLRLLDYREYVELVVEVRRQTAEAWEPANPTRLSTGEAIGVGAALMMVVLTQWEWDASLLRPRAELGSVRFLFLDEANRLSRDNLGVLFDLCRSLSLQLLVAAPEVARADGNTTYRLVRHTTEDGREEVIVSGRRAASVVADDGEGLDGRTLAVNIEQ